ncbi:Sensor protein PhoQ [Rhodobacteraceae bacterium THAF1]|nr:Sensor protein PhoQ [Palleronia sp. THAF1]VDC27809.1 Sensor protein PhoQ [Rhodobacteraceae bacterium THAF1]
MTVKLATACDFRALDAVGNPVFVIRRDVNGADHMIHLNASYRDIVGEQANAMLGPVAEVFPARLADSLRRNCTDALNSPAPIVVDELLAIAGKQGWWRTTLTRDPADHDRVIGSAVNITDLEARGESLTRRLADSHERLDELGTVAALTAHDTRAPLANVVSLIEIVLEGFQDLGDGRADILRSCKIVAVKALDSVEALMSRVGSAAPSVRRLDRVDLSRTCREIAAIVDPMKRLDITYPDTAVMTDVVILQVTLRNLLDNAARYARSRIAISIEAENDNHLNIVVADDGPGFPDGIDPTHSIDGVTPITGKRGYGMQAVARLLRGCGGSLCPIAPRFGTGATVRIHLPGMIISDTRMSKTA